VSRQAQASVTVRTQPPVVSITAPVVNSEVTGVVNVTATATASTGATITQVQLFIDDASTPASVGGALAFAWSTREALAGPHVLRVVATDSTGNTGVATLSVTVRNPPLVELAAPAEVVNRTVTLSATVQAFSGATPAKVDFFVGETLLGTDTDAAFSFAWDTTQHGNGPYVLTVKGYDSNGNVVTSAPVNVRILNEVNAQVGCGCGTTGSGAGLGGLLALFVALRGVAGRERRRRAAARS
jgi:hypothetical protein